MYVIAILSMYVIDRGQVFQSLYGLTVTSYIVWLMPQRVGEEGKLLIRTSIISVSLTSVLLA